MKKITNNNVKPLILKMVIGLIVGLAAGYFVGSIVKKNTNAKVQTELVKTNSYEKI